MGQGRGPKEKGEKHIGYQKSRGEGKGAGTQQAESEEQRAQSRGQKVEKREHRVESTK
jgi:hypothetical protein